MQKTIDVYTAKIILVGIKSYRQAWLAKVVQKLLMRLDFSCSTSHAYCFPVVLLNEENNSGENEDKLWKLCTKKKRYFISLIHTIVPLISGATMFAWCLSRTIRAVHARCTLTYVEHHPLKEGAMGKTLWTNVGLRFFVTVV